MKPAWRFNFKHYFIQFVCLLLCTSFLAAKTGSVLAEPAGNYVQSSDPFSLTDDKKGFFQGLPDNLKGFFSDNNQTLNGFFRYIEQRFGGASARQSNLPIPSYPPYEFPLPTSADFIKVTSSWTASCTADKPPDEPLLPAISGCPPSTDKKCPWTPAQPPPCPNRPGAGCCTFTDAVNGAEFEACVQGGPGGYVSLENRTPVPGPGCVFYHWQVIPNTPACGGMLPAVTPGNYRQMCINGGFVSGANYTISGNIDCGNSGNFGCSVTAR